MIKLPKRTVETERLLLQPYSMKYVQPVFDLIRKNKHRLTHSFPKLLSATETQDATRDFVQQKIFDWNRNRAFGFIVFLKDTHSIVGHFNIKDIDWKARQCELAYFIDEDLYRQGLITEAIRALLKVCFEELQLERVMARIVTSNTASLKLVEKAGLKYEGTFYKDYTTYDKQVVDTYRYGISRQEYNRK